MYSDVNQELAKGKIGCSFGVTMIESIFYGLATGAVMSVMLGTVFFALIQNSIDNGFKSAIFISVGVITSDILLISLSYFNAQLIPEGGTTEMIVRCCGALFLIGYGISNLVKKKRIAYPATTNRRIFRYMGEGFLLNILNPGNFIGWLAISTQLSQVFKYSASESVSFYSGAVIAIFSMEMLIAFTAISLKRFFTARMLTLIDRVVGVLFIGFAIYLVIPVVDLLFS